MELDTLDDWMADVLALLLSGKMYGIFALLFGLSFFILKSATYRV